MLKILYIIFISLIVTNCSTKKVEKHHGVPFLEKKQSSLVVNETNVNDIKYLKTTTNKEFKNENLLYNVFTSLREKINAPARNRGK